VGIEMILDVDPEYLGLNFIFVLVLFALFFIGVSVLARTTP